MKMDSLLEKELRLEEIMPLITEYLSQGKTVRFFPRGISMRPMLRQGVDSVVLSAPPQALKKYDIPLYQRDNGQYVLHRVTKVGQTYTCIGDNQYMPEPGLRQDQMIAVVVGFYRGERFHDVKETGYRLYCRFWHHTRWFRFCWRHGIDFLRACLNRLRRKFH
jgi:hypothetical protein